MIHINVQYHNNHVTKMLINGHAGYDEYGYDLVCAGVSSIGFGLCNALDIMCPEVICEIKDNLISITATNYCDRADVIINTGIIQLETMQEIYKDYIEISKQEV